MKLHVMNFKPLALRNSFLFAIFASAFLPISLLADTFGSGAFNIEFVTVGNAGNASDDSGYGGVNYDYRIGKHEVSRSMISAYNSLSGGPTISLADMTSQGGNGANRPATGVSWNEAARFVNWLNTSNGYSAAYNFTTAGANDYIAVWSLNDPGFNAENPYRNKNAYYFLPTENEWYKAAYYDRNLNGGTGGYWDYTTGSNTPPTSLTSGTTPGTAVFGQSLSTGPADIMNAGGLSPYGTMAQGGNVWERIESDFTAPNDDPTEFHAIRAGYWGNVANSLSSESRVSNSRAIDSSLTGFRVASVPELSSSILSVLGVISVAFMRRRLRP